MFYFKHIKTPAWAKSEDIYFLVIKDNEEYGYIGLQDVNFIKGVCENLCYKTHKKFRGKKESKYYLKEFLYSWCPFDFDIIKARVNEDNIASQKMLEFCGFEKTLINDNKKNTTPQISHLNKVKKPVPYLNKKEEKKEPAVEKKKYYFYKLKKFDF